MQQTLNFKYECLDEGFNEFFSELRRQYTICVHYLFNRLWDSKGNLSEKDLRALQPTIQNINMLDSWSFQCAVKESIQIYKSFKQKYDEHEETRAKSLKDLDFKHSIKKISDHKYAVKKKRILESLTLIFGGYDNMMKRQKCQISKDEFKENRLKNFYSIGEAQYKGNRKMVLNSDLTLTFKYNKDTHFTFKLRIPDAMHRDKLVKLYNAAQEKKLALTYMFDSQTMHISFESDVITPPVQSQQIENRVFGVDLNPNYIGWSVTDWKSSSEFNVISHGVIDLKKFSDIYKELNKLGDVKSDDPRRKKLNNKKNYEINIVGKHLIDIALHYKCQIFSIEDLNIKQKDMDKGKDYNALCNNHWLRTTLTYQIEKCCSYHKIKLLKVKPEYSSFIGNVLFRHISQDMPDMVLSSIEIGRRGYEFYNQYTIESKEKVKNIVQPNINDFENYWKMSLEILELTPVINESINTFIKLYEFIKTRKDLKFDGDPYKVRVQFTPVNEFRFFSKKSNVFIY